ncbi:peptide/nickel transport system substrate-binding protein [Aminobacter lissarensis]|uniref:Peptide/nickel transport system substrate-binding protein n=1 Tax=Aminobacter carboxidus TaxID=376165 RepID=A0A8E2BEC0_9HYPH|nr:ABC transporter substrate-binding protein [Aminobacter lissarensis]MBB6466705.1 peptide/nickel transport system substrate-binding protein [Aminobacter lissarensis]
MQTIKQLSVLAILLGTAASATSSLANEAGTLRVAIHSDIASLNPGVNRDANSDMVLAHVVEGLVGFGDDLTVKPMLADSWTTNDDATVYEFKLRDGVKFHDGKPLTAEDVVWNFNRYLEPATTFQCVGRYDGQVGPKLAKIEAVDAGTVRFSFDAPAPNFLITLATIQCTPWILSRSSVDENGAFAKPVGTGPFAFDTQQSGRFLDLVRFKDYAALPGKPDGYVGNKTANLERVRFMVVPDASTRSNGLQSGEIDVIDEVEPSVIESLRTSKMTVDIQPTPAWMTLQLQTTAPALSDPKMRRAIAHAIDLTQLSAALGGGLYTPNPSVLAKDTYYYDNSAAAWPAYDVELARKLAGEAGYKGEEISVLVANRQNRVQVATIIQAMLSQAGIKIRLDVRDWATQLDQYRAGKYELAVFAYSARLDPLLSYQSYIGDKKAEPTRMWDDARATELLAKVSTLRQPEERKKVFSELNAEMGKQVPILGLFNIPSVTALSPGVKDFAGWQGGTNRFWGVTKVAD